MSFTKEPEGTLYMYMKLILLADSHQGEGVSLHLTSPW